MADNKIIDGKLIAETMKKEIAAEVANMIDSGVGAPHLAAVLVGEDGASLTYVASKEKACRSVGMISSVYRLSEKSTEEDILKTIDFLNNDPEIDGYIVQLPLPKHINETKIIQSINHDKDVDGFTLYNIGLMQLGEPCYQPATPFGIIELLKRSNVEIAGKHIVVMGRSNIVGTPVSVMLSRKGIDATVTICHSKTQNLKELTRQADILIVAIGDPQFVKADMVKEGAVVIDVGIHRIKDNSEKGYHVVGDVDYDEVYKVASKITPVPGGVGPMTIVSLLHNTLMAAKNNKK
ncbi:MAG: bifunctional 5,10-methylenetetrahydrofolate dehydrogenase/5,10-methenyltetrahydrofolate cyclohydrolase [Bacteroidales bacterium]|jgi:methylenetetrahydrofolate dehydrogenase (NADP+)/methenyltetrahydrofolate cyclohydrolase|nr:bifunctional 5,10-methylenetetrahydrofolate dehydrogenase/5,10-methenyltetrahydrofolate cyclohydrolase [Bacteroidales bacterium]MBO5848442.1 bifunctional 5,10-methylenetetrahydrofolate dehydrogenase/5,10-methenyltetrahydrofolate cyclohydrolase [Bacteroidales bacterium]